MIHEEKIKYICECGNIIIYDPGYDCPICGEEIAHVEPDGKTWYERY